MRPSSPLLPVAAAASLPPPPSRPLSPAGLLSKLLILPARTALGGVAFVGAVLLSAHTGLSRRASAACGFGALGASQAVVVACAALQLRRGRQRQAEKELAAKVTSLMAWNEALGAVRKIVDTFSDGLAAPFTFKHLLLDAELLRRHHTALYDAQVARKWSPSEEQPLIDGRHFANYAMASYGFALLKLLGLMDEAHDLFVDGARPIDVVMHQLDLQPQEILVAGLDGDELGLPRHFVARDASTKSIVIVVRGTNSLSDVLVDLLCDSAPFAAGYAHSGMRDAAQALFTATLPTLRAALQENKGYTLVTAGHSMGGGVAILLTKILLDAGFAGTKCFAISPPPVFGPVHRVDGEWSAALECFVHMDDIVPRLSLESARALVMEIERIDGLPLSDNDLRGLSPASLHIAIAGRRSVRRSGGGGGGGEREKLVAPLHIPTSHVHWLLPREDVAGQQDEAGSQYVSVRAESSVFSRMLITRRCVASHFPNKYVSALNSLPLAPRPPLRRRAKPGLAAGALHYDGELGF
jgi:pimeloyl-ACP methyl ester carboxylesterase